MRIDYLNETTNLDLEVGSSQLESPYGTFFVLFIASHPILIGIVPNRCTSIPS